jgi:hypothetical protein
VATIEVSSEVYQRLATFARPFEGASDAINRLLDAAAPGTGAPTNGGPKLVTTGPHGDLVSRVGRVPNGAKLRTSYKGREFFALVRDGRVVWGGRSFESLSKAAVAVIRSTGSNRPTENGWRFWEVQVDGEKGWRSAEKYRDR